MGRMIYHNADGSVTLSDDDQTLTFAPADEAELAQACADFFPPLPPQDNAGDQT